MGLNSVIFLLAVSLPDDVFSNCSICCFTSREQRDLYAKDARDRGMLVSTDSDFIDKYDLIKNYGNY